MGGLMDRRAAIVAVLDRLVVEHLAEVPCAAGVVSVKRVDDAARAIDELVAIDIDAAFGGAVGGGKTVAHAKPLVDMVIGDLLASLAADLEEAITANPNEEPLRWFRFSHLPPDKAGVSADFADLAVQLLTKAPASTQRTRALECLLAAKDCAVRASMVGR